MGFMRPWTAIIVSKVKKEEVSSWIRHNLIGKVWRPARDLNVPTSTRNGYFYIWRMLNPLHILGRRFDDDMLPSFVEAATSSWYCLRESPCWPFMRIIALSSLRSLSSLVLAGLS
jgi:hypothetical protein